MGSNSQDSRDSNLNKEVQSNKRSKPYSQKRKKSNEKEKQSKKTSWVWDHFTTYNKDLMRTNEDGKLVKCGHTRRAVCKHCEADLDGNTNQNGTSTLQKHIEHHCGEYPGSSRNAITGQKHFVVDLEGKDNIVTHWSQENCLKAAVEMIVIDELPFSTIEKQGFKRFCAVAVPKWHMPCRKVVVKSILSMYNEKKEYLKAELSNHRISLTTDTWTSIQNINYMVLTAHFIDSGWTMHKRVLNFCVIPNHQGSTIGKILENCLQEWSIKNVLTISVDNASTNKVALDYMRKKLNTGDKQLLLDGKFLHVRCLAHIVNLIVKSGLKCMEKSVASIRNAVRYVRSSSARLSAFKECVKKDELESKKVCVLDVPTRWNSTFVMLDTALELKVSFDRLADEEDMKYKGYFDENEEEDEDDDQQESKGRKRVGPPTDDDWDRATVFVKFLKVFFETTVSVSATNKPTAHKAFQEIVTIKCEIDALHNKPLTDESTETEKILFNMAMRMRKKYISYFESTDNMNQLFLVALVLDPRFKLRYFERVLEKMLGCEDDVVRRKSGQLKDLIVKLTDLYATSNGTQASNMKKEMIGSSSGSRHASGIRALMLEDWENNNGNAIVVSHEVDRYLLDPIEKLTTEFDILTWWRLNGSKYPNLQLVAKDVLAIQVSSVASESSFSTGKRVIDPHRSSLTPRSVEALICLQNWLKSDSISSLAYAPTPEEIEFFENTEKELDQEQREKMEKQTEEIVEKKNKSAKANKGCDARTTSRK